MSLSMALTALRQDGQNNSCVADFATRKTLPYLRRLSSLNNLFLQQDIDRIVSL